MATNNADFNCLFTFYQADGATALYLTVDGISGSQKLTMEAWLRRSPLGAVAVTFSTADYLEIQDAPNDNQLFLGAPYSVMQTLVAAVYSSDFLALISPTSRHPYGSFLLPVEQGITTPT